MQDLFKSAFDLNIPGVERHATITQRILEGPALIEPDYAELINRIALVVLGLLAAAFTIRLPGNGGIATSILLVAVWWGAGQLALFPGGIRLNFVYPAIAILLNFIAMTVLRIVREEQQRRAAEKNLRIATNLDPWKADYFIALGTLYKEVGLHLRAKKAFEQAKVVDPSVKLPED